MSAWSGVFRVRANGSICPTPSRKTTSPEASPLSAAARRAVTDLVDFLKMRGFQSHPDSPLLQDRRHRRLPVREVQRLVQKYREAAGLDVRATPHSLRHSWASQLARAGSLRAVQQMAGHKR